MSVSSIFASGTSDISSIFSAAGASSPLSSDATGLGSSSSTPASTSVSSQGKFLSELQTLQSTDPTEFKQVTADISTQLQAAAQQAGGSQGQTLSSLAAKFQQASQTGSLAPLEPGVHGKHHGGGHHHGGGSPDTATTDPSSDTTAPDSLFSTVSLTGTASAATSASALAASAYQKSSGQGLEPQISAIIGQVLGKDLASAATNDVAFQVGLSA